LIVAAREGRVEDEGWRVRKDGSPVHGERDHQCRQGCPRRTCRGFVKITRDITERKQIENKLVEANERFAVAAEAAGLGFWDFDIEARSVRWDDQMFRLHGLVRREWQ
jgi:PAS domain-containing protein